MSCNTGRGSCGAHSSQTSHGCGAHECNSHETQNQFKTAGYFIQKIKEEVEEGFEVLHDEIEELEDKINRLEKLIKR